MRICEKCGEAIDTRRPWYMLDLGRHEFSKYPLLQSECYNRAVVYFCENCVKNETISIKELFRERG